MQEMRPGMEIDMEAQILYMWNQGDSGKEDRGRGDMQHHIEWSERAFGPLPEFLDNLIELGHTVAAICITRYHKGVAVEASIIVTEQEALYDPISCYGG